MSNVDEIKQLERNNKTIGDVKNKNIFRRLYDKIMRTLKKIFSTKYKLTVIFGTFVSIQLRVFFDTGNIVPLKIFINPKKFIQYISYVYRKSKIGSIIKVSYGIAYILALDELIRVRLVNVLKKIYNLVKKETQEQQPQEKQPT